MVWLKAVVRGEGVGGGRVRAEAKPIKLSNAYRHRNRGDIPPPPRI